MKQLGFVRKPRLYPVSLPSNVTQPVIVTAVTSSNWKNAHGFAKSVKMFLPKSTFVMYGVLTSYDVNEEVSAGYS